VRAAAERGATIAVVNRGATRADDLAHIRIHDADVGDTLDALARAVQRERLAGGRDSAHHGDARLAGKA
jgi:hypothetical protein